MRKLYEWLTPSIIFIHLYFRRGFQFEHSRIVCISAALNFSHYLGGMSTTKVYVRRDVEGPGHSELSEFCENWKLIQNKIGRTI